MTCVTLEEATRAGRRCCDSLVALRRWIVSRHNKFTNLGCFNVRNKRGSTRLSLHAEGRAVDIGVKEWRKTEYNEAMWVVVNALVEQHCTLGIQRIVWDRHSWNPSLGVVAGPDAWNPLSAAVMKKGSHRDHAHIEVSKDKCSGTTLEDIQRIFSSLIVPGGNNDGITPPVTTPGTPATTPTLDQYDVSGQWSRDTILEVATSVIGATDLDNIETHVICGGRGGYCVNMETGQIFHVGLGVYQWTLDFGGPLLSFVPYGYGYFVLLADGLTVTSGAYPYMDATFECDDAGPWDELSCTVDGFLVLSKTDSNMNITQCSSNRIQVAVTMPDICCGDVAWTLPEFVF